MATLLASVEKCVIENQEEAISRAEKRKLTQLKREKTKVYLLEAHGDWENERSRWTDVNTGTEEIVPRPRLKTCLEIRNGIGNMVLARKGAELRMQKSNGREIQDTNTSNIPKINVYFAQHLIWIHQKHCNDCYCDQEVDSKLPKKLLISLGIVVLPIHTIKTNANYHLLESEPETRSEPVSLLMECSICKQIFNNSHLLVQHVIQVHISTPISTVLFYCPFCELAFSTKDSLKYHFINFHSSNPENISVNNFHVVNGTIHPLLTTTQISEIYSILPTTTDTTEEVEEVEIVIPKIEVDTTCRLCLKEFDSEESLGLHLNQHALKIKYCCQVCNENFFEKKKLHNHFRTHSDQEIYRLLKHERDPIIGSVTPGKDSCDLPKSSSSFKCILCGKVTFERMDHHLKLYHKDVEYYVFQCHVCQMFFGSRKEIDGHFSKHIRTENFINGVIQCNICQLFFINQKEMEAHFSKHIGNEIANNVKVHLRPTQVVTIDDQGQTTTVKRYNCNRCPRTFNRPYLLKRHLEICGKNIKYTCQDCPMSYGAKITLERHVEKKHVVPETKIHLCKTCGSSFSQVKFLKKHELNHKNNKYKCEVCNKGPFCKSVLREHLKSHRKKCTCGVCKDCTEIKQLYPCPECKKVLSNPTTLKNHLKIHDGEESLIHECHVCHKKFRHQPTLRKHVKIHETICNCGTCDFCESRDPKTPKCPICSKMFHTNHHLNRHMVVHTGERSFVCEICGKGFNQAGNLKYHVNSHLRQKEKKKMEK